MTDMTTQPEAPPARRTAPRAERRQQLIDAAMAVIAQNGLSATTTGDVTRRAGLSMGLVNHHFGSKDNLLAAVLTHLAEDLRDAWAPRMTEPGLGPAGRVQAIVDALFSPVHCSPVRIRCWFAFFGDAGYRKVYREMADQFDTERADALRQVFAELCAAGGYEGVDPQALALRTEALADGFWLMMMLYPDDIDRAGARRDLLKMLADHFPRHIGPDGVLE